MCSTLLGSAIDDSRSEMDELAVQLMQSDVAVPAGVVTKLQSIDRLMQRLTNVNTNLKRIEQYLALDDSSVTERDWQDLLISAKAMYTMEQERELFDQYFGSIVEQRSNDNSDNSSNDTELFDNVSLF